MTKQKIDELSQQKLFSGRLGCMKDFEVKLDDSKACKTGKETSRIPFETFCRTRALKASR